MRRECHHGLGGVMGGALQIEAPLHLAVSHVSGHTAVRLLCSLEPGMGNRGEASECNAGAWYRSFNFIVLFGLSARSLLRSLNPGMVDLRMVCWRRQA